MQSKLSTVDDLPHYRAGMQEPLLNIDLPGFTKLKSGKVREIFDLGDAFLFVATDRISAFDCVMPNGIPRKGEVLNGTEVAEEISDENKSERNAEHSANGLCTAVLVLRSV